MSLSDVVTGSRPEPPQDGRSVHRARERRRRRKRRRSWLVLLVSLLVLGLGAGGAWLGLRPVIESWREPNDWTGSGSGAVTVQVAPGDTGVAIGRTLAEAGVVKTAKAFVEVSAADPRAASIQPGTYRLRERMSAASALAVLLDPRNRVTRTLRIAEGARADEVYAELVRQLGFAKADVLAAARDREGIGLPAAARGNPEGFLFPATYEFGPDATPTDVLAAMVQRAGQALDEAGVPQADRRAVVIKASLVEAEGGRQEYFGKVARVLENRLQAGRKLQLDSTVSYATKRFAITTTAQERAIRSPYNTYRYKGLPAGPISNPGTAAIDAVLRPTPGKWMYFVGVNPDTKETKFAVTAAEHERNVKEFQAWLRRQPG